MDKVIIKSEIKPSDYMSYDIKSDSVDTRLVECKVDWTVQVNTKIENGIKLEIYEINKIYAEWERIDHEGNVSLLETIDWKGGIDWKVEYECTEDTPMGIILSEIKIDDINKSIFIVFS